MTIALTTTSKIREVIDEKKAQELISTWKEQLLKEKSASDDDAILCDKIVLDGKSYTSDAATMIADFLTSTEDFQPSIASGIRIAILSDIIASRMEAEGLEVLTTISNAFRESQLEVVDLSDNAMGSKGVKACETVLGGSAVIKSLRCLKLCNNGLSESTMDEVAELLTRPNADDDSSCIADRLEQIHFFNNMSDDAGCSSFKKIIKCTMNPTDIRFSGTRAKAKGSIHITSALNELALEGKLANVTRLDLADNSFGECYQALSEALRTCAKLEYLDLHDCCIGDDGIVQVCDALLDAKAPLSFLSISGNDIGAESMEGVKRVVALISSINGSIVSFSASENEMKSPGIRSIARSFKSETLREIHMNQNECGSVGAKELIEMAKRVPNLEVIELNGNGFLPAILTKLNDAFGEKLGELDDNEDEDYDDDLDSEELEDDLGIDCEDDEVQEDPDADVDALADALNKIGV
ncbi:MAG: Ran GTPase-activating protein 1 [Bacillariaceae sp.]|jgi:Ran GTPase-activating protein (RanGAP) involved in mRNA processing and transport